MMRLATDGSEGRMVQLGRSEWRLDDDNFQKSESGLGLQTYLPEESRRVQGP